MTGTDPSTVRLCPACRARIRGDAWFCPACNADVLDASARESSAAASSGPPAEAAPALTMPEPAPRVGRLARAADRIGRRTILLVGAVAATVALGSIVLPRLRSVDGPEQTVEAFFTSLAQRDEAGAMAIGGCANSPVCTDGGLDTGYAPPLGLRIDTVEYGQPQVEDPTRRPNKDVATVHVTYLVGADTHTDLIRLARTEANGSREWTFANPVGRPLVIKSPVETSVTVGGASTRISSVTGSDGKERSRNIWLVPGVYDIQGESTVLFDADPQQVAIGGRDNCVALPGSGVGSSSVQELRGVPGVRVIAGCVSPNARLDLKLRAGVLDEIMRQVRAYIDKCATQPVPRPRVFEVDQQSESGRGSYRRCPFSEDDYANRIGNQRDLRWRIKKYPRLVLETPSQGTVPVRTSVPGVAVLSFDWTTKIIGELTGWKRVTVEVPVRVEGRAMVDPSDPGAILWTSQ